ncbi:MAG: hypothetical protein CNLJKLNK_00855 [Holosporales bacterium]
MQSAEEVPSLAFFSVNQEQYFKNLTEDSNFLSKINNETIENLFFYLRNLQSKNLLGEKALTTQEIETHLELEKETLERFTTQKTSVFAQKILLGMKKYYKKNSDKNRTVYLSQLKRDKNFPLKIKILIDLDKNNFFELSQKQEELKLFEQDAQCGDKDAEKFALILKTSIAQTKKETLDPNVINQLKARAQSDPELMMLLYKVYKNGIGGYTTSSTEAFAEEIKWLRCAADAGNTEALRALGLCYEHGNGIPMDKYEALKLYEKAAHNGDNEAEKFALMLKADISMKTKGILDPNVMAQLKERAQSDAELMMVLYKVYQSGIGGYPASSQEALAEGAKWLKRAADAGNAQALKALGLCYVHGSGVPVDKCEAIKLFEQAALHGDKEAEKLALVVKAGIAQAKIETLDSNVLVKLKDRAQSDAELMVLLYKVYISGIGGYPASSQEALTEAMKWLKRAADADNTEALKALGLRYELGTGVPMNKYESLRLYEKAAHNGDKEAEKFALIVKASIAQMKKETLDPNVMAQLKERAQSDAELMMVLYKVYQSGIGGYPASSQEALAEEIKWLRCAADAGNTEALKALGLRYELGTGVPMDKYEALKLYEKAVLCGDKEAEKFVLVIKVNIAQTKKETLDPNVIIQLKERAQSAPALMMILYKVYDSGVGEYPAVSPETIAEGIKWLRCAADAGNTEALMKLGLHYLLGKGVPVDKHKASSLFEQAAFYGDKSAEKCVLMLKAGISIDTKETLAANLLEQLKEGAQSDAELMMVLYKVYKNGVGEYPAASPETLTEEIKWLRWAVDAGNKEALKELGVHYVHGTGVPVDKYEALKLFEQAAHYGDKEAEKFALIVKADISIETKETLAANIIEQLKERAQSDPTLMMLLYNVYKNGVGGDLASLPEALTESIKWLRCAVDAGSARALKALGIHYEHGIGVPVDKYEAIKLFQQAALHGDQEAEKFALVLSASIAQIKKETLDPNVMAQLKERAQSDAELMMVLYKVYQSGIGGDAASSPEALAESIKWLKRAADADNTEALKDLGIHSYHGKGVPMDKHEALRLFEQAALHGDQEGKEYALILKKEMAEAEKKTLDSKD